MFQVAEEMSTKCKKISDHHRDASFQQMMQKVSLHEMLMPKRPSIAQIDLAHVSPHIDHIQVWFLHLRDGKRRSNQKKYVWVKSLGW